MIPSATYRLQFRNGVTFETAIDLIPHLQDLGISHLYASPIFTATNGSTHGYDIVDANEIDPVLGGYEGFARMVQALQDAGLGLILDIVPNHMAASVENAWWRDVLRRGKASHYAGHFDIDWSKKLTLPILDQATDDVLAAGDLKLARNPADGSLELDYRDTRYPLNAESVETYAAELDGDDKRLASLSKDLKAMERLLQSQHWQLIHWKDAASQLSYRRFFEVTGLVGVRVEDEKVFQDSHRLIIDLIASGQAQGLRVDHIDGLADPSGYLDRLRAAVGADTYILVEKILGPNEQLPSHWPVAGTTGYEFISALTHLFVDPDGLNSLQTAYSKIAPEAENYEQALRAAKQLMVMRNFEGEVGRLVDLCRASAASLSDADLRDAIRELLIAFRVYRTYGFEGTLSDNDKRVLKDAVDRAYRQVEDDGALRLIERILSGDVTTGAAAEFRIRFQQLSGPVMAKALEDTLFYRFNRLIAMNEVGGEPSESPRGAPAFHAAMAERLQTQATALSATSTHDTKRGEDARARLYALSEGAPQWSGAFKRWNSLNHAALTSLEDGAAPEPNTQWMLYQSLAGIWPDRLADCNLEDLRERFMTYTEKAIKEAKLRSDWAAPREDYEQAATEFAGQLLSAENSEFLKDFDDTMRPFLNAGLINSLSQTLIKLTAPGVPDIYQGTDGGDFSLVDPDNRRPVDASNPASRNSFDQRKSDIIRTVLAFRRQNPDLFHLGSYEPLYATGARSENVVAFGRRLKNTYCITVTPRGVLGQVVPETGRVSSGFWGDTTLQLSGPLGHRMTDMLSGHEYEHGEIRLSDLFATEDASFLVKTE